MRFPDETPLDDVISYIKKATKRGSNEPGIQVYVDPIGLQEAERSLNSTVTYDHERTSLESALPLLLKQVGLSYCVKDGLLFISSPSGVEQERKESSSVRTMMDSSQTKIILTKLNNPNSILFAQETPLAKVADYIKRTTKSDANDLGIQCHIDPEGLKEAERSMDSTVQLELEGIPLKVTLRLLLKQVGPAYYVRDDMLVISSEEDIHRELGDSPKDRPMGDDQAAKSEFESLFNGRDLTGWSDVLLNGSEWKVIDGILEGRGGGDRGNPALLLTDRRDFKDFELRITARYPLKGAGRIEIRHVGADDNMSGYHIAHGRSDQQPGGSVGHARDSRYGGYIDWDLAASPSTIDVDQWHTFDVIAAGNRIIVSINDNRVLDYSDPANSYATGGVAMICGYNSYVQIKEIRIKRLPDGADPDMIRERVGGGGLQ